MNYIFTLSIGILTFPGNYFFEKILPNDSLKKFPIKCQSYTDWRLFYSNMVLPSKLLVETYFKGH